MSAAVTGGGGSAAPDAASPDAVEAVAEAMSQRLNTTTDTWFPAQFGMGQYLPAMSADTTSVIEAARGVLETDWQPALDALAAMLAARHPATLLLAAAPALASGALDDAITRVAQRHTLDPDQTRCTCGADQWSATHVAVSATREALTDAH